MQNDDANSKQAIAAERQRREGIWQKLLARSGPISVSPQILRELGIYGGAQGIWVDVNCTRSAAAPAGIAVGLLHTGKTYADDLDETGVLYHYPKTQRPSGRDASEVEATKAAREQNMPVFVITHSSVSGLRDVHRGWIQDWDDAAELFIVSFAESQPAALPTAEQEEETPFALTSDGYRGQRLTTTRPGQPTFKFRVMRRYLVACAVCGLEIDELLDAAHIRDKRHLGCDDPRNGMVLCATHHRAFDRYLFAIEPDTFKVVGRPKGPTLQQMKITVASLSTFPKKPHPEALRWRWEQWLGRVAPAKSQASAHA